MQGFTCANPIEVSPLLLSRLAHLRIRATSAGTSECSTWALGNPCRFCKACPEGEGKACPDAWIFL